MPANERPPMADPVATLIAARAQATPGPVGVIMAPPIETEYGLQQTTLILRHNLFKVAAIEKLAGLIAEDHGNAAYIAAAYDPALVPALEALQAEALRWRQWLRRFAEAATAEDLVYLQQRLTPQYGALCAEGPGPAGDAPAIEDLGE